MITSLLRSHSYVIRGLGIFVLSKVQKSCIIYIMNLFILFVTLFQTQSPYNYMLLVLASNIYTTFIYY